MDKNNTLLEEDKLVIGNLPFKRLPTLEQAIHYVHMLLAIPEQERDADWFQLMRYWLMIPYTLWPVDFQNFIEDLAPRILDGKPMVHQERKVLENFQVLPNKKLIKLITSIELRVQAGNYDLFLSSIALAKFDAAERALLDDPEVIDDIEDFFKRNPQFGPNKAVLRRRMVMERNFRPPNWKFDPEDPKALAYLEFDSLCYKHNLYGVELTKAGYKPLLQKLSINPTPHGIMLFIPRYWSFDPKRDILWGKVTAVLRAWGTKRQGPKWSAGRAINQQTALIAIAANEEATALNLTGEQRYDHVKAKAGLNKDMDPGTLYRIIRYGKQLRERQKKREQRKK